MTLRRIAATLGLAVALAVAGCGGDDDGPATARRPAQRPKPDPQLMAIGERVFEEHFHSCHGLLGKPRTTPVIEFEAPSFDHVEPSAAYVRERVIGGGIGMQSFQSELSEREIDGIVAYVAEVAGREVDGEQADAAGADVLAQGESLFAQQCARCHGIAGREMAGRPGFPGTDFNKVKPSRRLVMRRMHVGLEDAMPSYTRLLDDAEFEAIAAYVASVAGERPD